MTGKGNMRGPDFLVIGAQRAGTTWIHLLLRQHKALWLPPVKELHYFDKPEVDRTLTDDKELRRVILLALYSPSLWHFPYLLGKRNQDWYVRLFQRARAKGLITGEITPAYATLGEEVWRRIHAMNDKIKLIFVMRDPVDRVWSSLNNTAKKNRLNGELTMATALKRAHSSGPTLRSDYPDTIRRLEAIFPPDQLYFCFFDDLRARPAEFARGLLTFLGVDPGDVAKLLPKEAVNVVATNKPIPPEFEREMARTYLPLVEQLCERFEGAPRNWRTRYEKLIQTERDTLN
jgi:hypothetical protein